MKQLIIKVFMLVLSLGMINWPLIPALQSYNETTGRIVLCCLGLSLMVLFQSSIIKYFNSIRKKQVTEQQVGLTYFGMFSGFLLLGINIISTARFLALWFGYSLYLNNYYGIYMSVLAGLLTMVNGVITIILVQRYLELLDKAKLGKESVILIWTIMSSCFLFPGIFIFYFSSDCEEERYYYKVVCAHLAFFQLMTLILMIVYLRAGIHMQPFKLTAGVVISYVVVYTPFNTYWFIKGIMMLWGPTHGPCFDEHVLEIAFLILYALTISPVVFGLVALIFVCFFNRFCPSQEEWTEITASSEDKATAFHRLSDPRGMNLNRSSMHRSGSSMHRKSDAFNIH